MKDLFKFLFFTVLAVLFVFIPDPLFLEVAFGLLAAYSGKKVFK